MGKRATGVDCGVTERVNRNTRRWFGYVEGQGDGEFIKKVYESVRLSLR